MTNTKREERDGIIICLIVLSVLRSHFLNNNNNNKKLDGLRVLPAEEHRHWRNVTDIATYVQKKKIMIIKREVEREPSPTRNKVHCYGIWIFRQPKQQQQQKENSYIIVYAIPPPTPGRNWKELH